jgi:hypothetical protein
VHTVEYYALVFFWAASAIELTLAKRNDSLNQTVMATINDNYLKLKAGLPVSLKLPGG